MDDGLGGEPEDQILSGVLSLSLTEDHGDPKVWAEIYLCHVGYSAATLV